MKILFLDDNEERRQVFDDVYGEKHNIYFAETVLCAITMLDEHSPFDIAYLDHDLGGQVFVASDEKSGYKVAQHITQMNPELRPKKVVVHSWNPAGAKNMIAILTQAGITTSYQPFPGNGKFFE